jgi:uracil-DNA glycosylase
MSLFDFEKCLKSNMQVKIHPEWHELLKEEFEKDYFLKLTEFVKNEYQTKQIFPPGKLIFNAFEKCPPSKVKVVIIGQDPYHGIGQAMGFSFSVPEGIKTPPSLVNIRKEIRSDLGIDSKVRNDLTFWADQGVLLLNSVLTVESGKAGSHSGKGWEIFTDEVIKKVSESKEKLVFILWGAYAQKKGNFINGNNHLIIKSAHPSPLSAYNGFFGSKPFSQANEFLKVNGKKEILW